MFGTSQQKSLFFCVARYVNFVVNQKASNFGSYVIKEFAHAFSSAHIEYGCTWEVWRALKKLELLSAVPQATLTYLSCAPNFLRASITRYTHAKHEQILKLKITLKTSRRLPRKLLGVSVKPGTGPEPPRTPGNTSETSPEHDFLDFFGGSYNFFT